MAALENTHCREKTNARTKTGAADLELARQFTLRRKAVARMHLAAADERANVLNDLHGELAMTRGLVVYLFDFFFHAESSSLRLSLRRVPREEKDS